MTGNSKNENKFLSHLNKWWPLFVFVGGVFIAYFTLEGRWEKSISKENEKIYTSLSHINEKLDGINKSIEKSNGLVFEHAERISKLEGIVLASKNTNNRVSEFHKKIDKNPVYKDISTLTASAYIPYGK